MEEVDLEIAFGGEIDVAGHEHSEVDTQFCLIQQLLLSARARSIRLLSKYHSSPLVKRVSVALRWSMTCSRLMA